MYGGPEVYTYSILRLRFIFCSSLLQFASAVHFCSSLLQFSFAVAQSHNNHMTSTCALIRNRQENNYAVSNSNTCISAVSVCVLSWHICNNSTVYDNRIYYADIEYSPISTYLSVDEILLLVETLQIIV